MTTDEQIEQILVDTHCWVTDTCGENAVKAIKKLLLEARIKTLQEPLDWGRGKTIVDTADGWQDFYRKHILHFQKRLDQLTKEADSL